MLLLNSFLRDVATLYRVESVKKLQKYFAFFDKIGVEFNESCVSLDCVEEYNEDLNEVLNEIKRKDGFKYIENLLNQEKVYEKLSEYKIDMLTLNLYKRLEKNDGLKELLESFKNEIPKIRYTRSNIVSGRLSIVKGPRLINLPKKYRNILKSRFAYGEICMIDFVSLEPRVARYVVGESAGKDIYQDVCDKMEFQVDRSVMKRAVISILYGGGENLEIGELSPDKIEIIRKSLHEYFNIKYLLELAMKRDEWGFYRSYWGRPIHWGEDVRLNQVLNGYIQSSAVDVALNGFLKLTQEFDEGIRPLFFIHDAMFVDVKKDSKQNLVNIVNQGYNCNSLGHFPLNLELISERKF